MRFHCQAMAGRIWSYQKDVGRGQVMCFCSVSWRFPNDSVAAFYHLSGVGSSPSFERVILNSCFLSFKPFQTYILDGNMFVVWIMPLCEGQHLEKAFQELLHVASRSADFGFLYVWVAGASGSISVAFAPRCCISRVALVNFLKYVWSSSLPFKAELPLIVLRTAN